MSPMTALHHHALIISAAAVLPGGLHAQVNDYWTLAEASAFVGGERVPLHRVTAGALLSDGSIVIGDEGNARVIVVGPEGEVAAEFGRFGQGPGDFGSISGLWTVNDTIVVADHALGRVSFWRPAGQHIRTVSVTGADGEIRDARGIANGGDVVVTTRPRHTADQGSGLFVDHVDLLRVSPSSRRSESLVSVEWGRTFVHVLANGMTGYMTPFIGQTVVATQGHRVIWVPFGLTEVRLLDLRDRPYRTNSVALPLKPRMVDRPVVNRYRDSLLVRARRQQAMFPNSVRQITESFGEKFPVPQPAATVSRAVVVGSDVWLQAAGSPEGEGHANWFVLNPERKELLGKVRVPSAWTVLGGKNDNVLVLQKDSVGVEAVTIHKVERRG